SWSGTGFDVPSLGCRFQTNFGSPESLVSVSLFSRRYWPHRAVIWIASASASTENVIPNDDGNIVLAGGAVKPGEQSSVLPTPPWASSSNSSGDSSCRLGASIPTR